MKGFQVVGRRLVEQCFVDGETETLWKMRERERERIYISSQDSIHMFNHSLILIFVSDLRSNMVNTDLLPAAP